jgi:hypothetical protein
MNGPENIKSVFVLDKPNEKIFRLEIFELYLKYTPIDLLEIKKNLRTY